MLVMKNYLSYTINRTQILITIFHFHTILCAWQIHTSFLLTVGSVTGSVHNLQVIVLM